MQETPETRAKLANAITQLRTQGRDNEVEGIVGAYKAKYVSGTTTPATIPEKKDNLVKTLGKAAISSELKFGKSIAGALPSFVPGSARYENNKLQEQQQSDDQLHQQQLAEIKRLKAAGKDTSKAEALLSQEMGRPLTELSSIVPSVNYGAGDVYGSGLGVALDIATFGGLPSAATKGAKTGKLLVQGAKSAELAPTLAKIGIKSSELAPKVIEGADMTYKALKAAKQVQYAKNVLTGAGIGYGYGVSTGLQEGKGVGAFEPGASTALGAAIPIIGAGFQKAFGNKDLKALKVIEKRQSELDKLDKYKTLKTTVEKGQQRGIDVKKVLSETDVLHGAVDKSGTITTKGPGGAVEQYTKEFIDGNEAIVSDILKKEGRSISPDVVRLKLEKAVVDSGIEGKALTQALKNVDDEVAGYALRAGENGAIPVSTLHSAKVNKYNNINFFTDSNVKQYDKTVAKALKELVQEHTTSVDVGKINQELSKHFSVIDYLEKLDGKKVDGGKLGKYFAQVTGGMVGSHFGPLGTVVGAEVGGGIKGNMMAQAFKGKTGKVLPQAEVIQDAIKVRDAVPLRLPQSSNSLGNRNIAQSKTINPTTIDIPSNIPSNPTKGKLPNADGGFIRIAGVKAQNIHPEDATVMKRFIDSTRLKKDLSNADYAKVEKLAERFGISMDKGLAGVANKFDDILAGKVKVKGTLLPGSLKKGASAINPLTAGAVVGTGAAVIANKKKKANLPKKK